MDYMKIVQALLAKAQASDFEEEAATYLAKAEELMIKHDIDRADLSPEQRDKIESKRVTYGSGTADRQLWHHVACARDVRFIVHMRVDKNTTASLIGFADDIAYVESVVASLMLQRERFLIAAKIWQPAGDKSFNNSFRHGYAQRVWQRFQEARRSRDHEVGTAIVLRDKKSQVDIAFINAFPHARSTAITTGRSRAGYRRGGEAADKSDLGQRRFGDSRKALS